MSAKGNEVRRRTRFGREQTFEVLRRLRQLQEHKRKLGEYLSACGGNNRGVIVKLRAKNGSASVRGVTLTPVYLVDGKTYMSRPDVARQLGLLPSRNDPESNDRGSGSSTATVASASSTSSSSWSMLISTKMTPHRQGTDDDLLSNGKNGEGRPKLGPDLERHPMYKLALDQWQIVKINEAANTPWRKEVQQYIVDGYALFPGLLSQTDVNLMLDGPVNIKKCSSITDSNNDGRQMRVRRGNQCWLGARKTIDACIRNIGTPNEMVMSPLTTREPGRYDMPLPPDASSIIEKRLEERGLLEFAKFLIGNGRIRTQDIMLSKPGSTEQRVHTDSSWDNKKMRNPRIHYLTILISLTPQTAFTGGTRVWPQTHRMNHGTIDWDFYADMIEPLLKPGDAIAFDGLLTHCGMRNSSDTDRYFYYAAFSDTHDPNTDVTGS